MDRQQQQHHLGTAPAGSKARAPISHNPLSHMTFPSSTDSPSAVVQPPPPTPSAAASSTPGYLSSSSSTASSSSPSTPRFKDLSLSDTLSPHPTAIGTTSNNVRAISGIPNTSAPGSVSGSVSGPNIPNPISGPPVGVGSKRMAAAITSYLPTPPPSISSGSPDTSNEPLSSHHHHHHHHIAPTEEDVEMSSSSSSTLTRKPLLPPTKKIPHHPQNGHFYPASTSSTAATDGSGIPGGDCKRLCVRHQRMANGGVNAELQQSIENLPLPDQQAVNTIWSLFSSSPSSRRSLILRGLLTICCPSQLSFLSTAIEQECRVDPFSVLPREVSLRILSYLDAISLGRAAQVSWSWKTLADDDVLWKIMCEQHIERKCEKCGWGLPLMERKRRMRGNGAGSGAAGGATSLIGSANSGMTRTGSNGSPIPPSAGGSGALVVGHRPLVGMGAGGSNGGGLGGAGAGEQNSTPVLVVPIRSRPPLEAGSTDLRAAKRPRRTMGLEDEDRMMLDGGAAGSATSSNVPSAANSRSNSPAPNTRDPSSSCSSSSSSSSSVLRSSNNVSVVPRTRPWKSVYCERLVIERNWRKGLCSFMTLTGHTNAITCIAVDETLSHPSFPILMSGSWDRTVRIWNLETGQEVGCLRGHTGGIRALQFDSFKVVTGAMDHTLKIWNWRTGECIRTLTGHRDRVTCLNYDRHVLVSGSSDSTIKVWDFETGSAQTLVGHREWVNDVKIWTPGAGAGAAGAGAGAGGQGQHGTNGGAGEMSGGMGFGGGGGAGGFMGAGGKGKGRGGGGPNDVKLLFSASDDMTIKVWDLNTLECVRTLSGHVAQVQRLTILTLDSGHHSSNGVPLPLSGSGSGSTDRAGSSRSGSRSSSLTRVSGSGGRHGGGGGGGGGRGWNANGNGNGDDETNNMNGFFELSPPSRHTNLAFGAPPATAPIFSSASSRPAGSTAAGTVAGPNNNLPRVDLGPNGQWPALVSCSLDNTLKIWDVDGGVCARTSFGHVEGIWDCDADKLRIVSGSHDRTIKIWDRESGRCIHTLVGHTGAVTCVHLADDKIVSGSDDSTIRVWNFGPEAATAAAATTAATATGSVVTSSSETGGGAGSDM